MYRRGAAGRRIGVYLCGGLAIYRCFCADVVLQIDEERVDVMVRCGGLQERMLWVQVWGSKNMDWCGLLHSGCGVVASHQGHRVGLQRTLGV